jgi:heptosyltransferase-2
MNILVRMPNWIGDLVMATPVLADLRKKFPEASITAMCRRPVCDLLELDDSIDELFCFTKLNGFVRRDDRRNIIEKIKNGKYDLGILLTNSFSSAWWFWQGNVKRRIGFSKNLRDWLLSDAQAMPKKGAEHQVDTYKRLLLPLGIPRSNTPPRLFVNDQEVEASKELLYQRGYRKGTSVIGIHPGAAYGSAKCWPSERYRALALQLLEKKNATIVFFGDAATGPLIKEICQGLPEKVLDLAGVTSLRELACLIKDCTVFLTNDSGPMHIAAAFNTPLVALFGSTDDRVTGPYGHPDAVIHKRPSCSPCFERVCPLDFRCMKGISVEEVVEKVGNYV